MESAKKYLDKPYNRVIKRITDESGTYYHATVLEFEGCQSTGDTYQEAFEGLTEAMQGWIATKLDAGCPIPAPSESDGYSGKFLVRIPKSLHAQLAAMAQKEGVSLNQYALYKLSR